MITDRHVSKRSVGFAKRLEVGMKCVEGFGFVYDHRRNVSTRSVVCGVV